jgi:hypothetical protein
VTLTSGRVLWLRRNTSSTLDLSRSKMDHRSVFERITGLEIPLRNTTLREHNILVCRTLYVIEVIQLLR